MRYNKRKESMQRSVILEDISTIYHKLSELIKDEMISMKIPILGKTHASIMGYDYDIVKEMTIMCHVSEPINIVRPIVFIFKDANQYRENIPILYDNTALGIVIFPINVNNSGRHMIQKYTRGSTKDVYRIPDGDCIHMNYKGDVEYYYSCETDAVCIDPITSISSYGNIEDWIY